MVVNEQHKGYNFLPFDRCCLYMGKTLLIEKLYQHNNWRAA